MLRISGLVVQSGLARGVTLRRVKEPEKLRHRATNAVTIIVPQRTLHIETRFRQKASRRVVRRGEIELLPPFATAARRYEGLDAILVWIPRRVIRVAMPVLAQTDIKTMEFRAVSGIRDLVLSSIAAELWDELSAARGEPVYIEALATGLIGRVLKRYAGCSSNILRWASSLDDIRIKRALAFLNRHFAEPVTLADVAREVGMSRQHLSEMFKTATGDGVHSLLRKLRLHQAQRMLRDTELRIGEIAERVGYASVSSFTNVFTAAFGMSPGKYRRTGNPWPPGAE